MLRCLITVSRSSHARHYAKHIVVNGIYTNLGGLGSGYGTRRKNKLKNSVINSGEIAATRRLVLLGAKGEGVYVDTSIGGTGVVLVGLDNIEVRALTLREAVLSVKLKLGGDNGILTPTMHVKGRLGEYKGTGIRESGTGGGRSLPGSLGGGGITSSVIHLEKTIRVDNTVGTRCLVKTTEGMDGIGKGINGVSVIERLGTEGLEEGLTSLKRSAVVYVLIGLDNPDKLLTGVVEVELNLVGRGTNRLVTSELNLLNEVLMRVLGHLAALIGVKEDVVYVKGSSYERLLVGTADRLCGRSGIKSLDGPEALTDRAEIDVNLNLVVLKSNKRKSESRVAAEPELKGNIESGLRKGVTGSAHLGGSTRGSTGSRYISETRVSDVGKSGGVANHLVVTRLLLLGEGKLVPDVHPVTVLTVNALTTNLDLNLGNELLTDVIQPAGIYGSGTVHCLVNLGKSDLKVCAVGKVAVSADCAGYATAEIGLTREGLFDGLHSEVSVASVRHLPEGNLGGSSKENVLGAIGDKLHKSSSHLSVVIQ
uniref:Uncharacterized protein n=1 Tax=viral metagenome TaxID=1070528 RepID=A0A6C0IT24_9ZZZZ